MPQENLSKKRKFEKTENNKACWKKGDEKGKVETGEGRWKFDVDYNDHFETPRIAYQDLLPVLETIAESLNKKLQDLIVYDPYYCAGQMKVHLASLGIPNVINENRDFYKDIKNNNIPAYDVLVTNPPYSGEHKAKLFEFLAKPANNNSINNNKTRVANKNGDCSIHSSTTDGFNDINKNNSNITINSIKPFAVLLPAYTATKKYWRDFDSSFRGGDTVNISSSTTASTNSAPAAVRTAAPFYIAPPDYYEYCHPEGTGKEAPPFWSAWFVGGLLTTPTPSTPSTAIKTSTSSTSGICKQQKEQKQDQLYYRQFEQCIEKLGKPSCARAPVDSSLNSNSSNSSASFTSSTGNTFAVTLGATTLGPRKLPAAVLKAVLSVDDLVSQGYIPPGDNRPSSKARKRMAAKKNVPAAGGTGAGVPPPVITTAMTKEGGVIVEGAKPKQHFKFGEFETTSTTSTHNENSKKKKNKNKNKNKTIINHISSATIPVGGNSHSCNNTGQNEPKQKKKRF